MLAKVVVAASLRAKEDTAIIFGKMEVAAAEEATRRGHGGGPGTSSGGCNTSCDSDKDKEVTGQW